VNVHHPGAETVGEGEEVGSREDCGSKAASATGDQQSERKQQPTEAPRSLENHPSTSRLNALASELFRDGTPDWPTSFWFTAAHPIRAQPSAPC
jgi:hypothetical protein